MLAEYDEAVAVCTDSLLAFQKTLPAPLQDAHLYLATKTEDGWQVVFGALDEKKGSYAVALETSMKSEAPGVRLNPTSSPRLDTDLYYRMACAMNTCKKSLTVGGPNYNYAVLPAEAGQFYVYFYPGSSTPGVYLLGADVRYTVSKDGMTIIETRPLHKGILPYPGPGIPEHAEVAAGMHSAVTHDEPEDTDVMHVLQRRPKIPEFIGTKNWRFLVDVTGNITLVKHSPRDAGSSSKDGYSTSPRIDSQLELEMETYLAKVERRVKQQWFPPKRPKLIAATVLFDIGLDGVVSPPKLLKSSGVRSFDSAALAAVSNASPMPTPPASIKSPLKLQFTFDLNALQVGRTGGGGREGPLRFREGAAAK